MGTWKYQISCRWRTCVIIGCNRVKLWTIWVVVITFDLLVFKVFCGHSMHLFENGLWLENSWPYSEMDWNFGLWGNCKNANGVLSKWVFSRQQYIRAINTISWRLLPRMMMNIHILYPHIHRWQTTEKEMMCIR